MVSDVPDVVNQEKCAPSPEIWVSPARQGDSLLGYLATHQSLANQSRHWALAAGSGSQRPSTMPGIHSLFLNCAGVQEVPRGALGHQAALRELEDVAIYQPITPVVQSFHQAPALPLWCSPMSAAASGTVFLRVWSWSPALETPGVLLKIQLTEPHLRPRQ